MRYLFIFALQADEVQLEGNVDFKDHSRQVSRRSGWLPGRSVNEYKRLQSLAKAPVRRGVEVGEPSRS